MNSLLGNRYQLLRTLGTGGMAIVYLARDTMLERPVAVKILREDFQIDEAFRERFRQEAKAAANLSHPNIVTVHDFGLDIKSPYIVMEYLPGTNLKDMIKEHGKFTTAETISLISQAAEGLGYAHRAGLVHCDVKPQNFLVTPDHQLKVTDFGIARALSTIHPDEQSDVVWGSPQYFSPEQAAGHAPSPASDVYSLGVIMYEMLTGRLPFNSEDPNELIRQHQEVAPIPPRRFSPEIPVPVEEIVLKLLSKEPSARYRTADQLARVLKSVNQQRNTPTLTPNYLTEEPDSAYTQPATVVAANQDLQSDPSDQQKVKPVKAPENINLITVGLGLLAFTAIGGLIPFWLYVWLTLTSTAPIP